MKKTVCIATYNGESYIEKQLQSVITQLSNGDELIISDDSSNDNTLKIARKSGFNNLIVLEGNSFYSPVLNFENALKYATGDIVFLSDQDDIWVDNKILIMSKYLRFYDLVVSDAVIINEYDKIISPSFYKIRNSGSGFIKNLYKNTYTGCCMAFNRKILVKALPFPSKIHMHDWWLGMVAEMYGTTYFCNEKLVRYRRHSSNASPNCGKSIYSTLDMIKFRYKMIKALSERYTFNK
ncbi:MAG: glycosyltransferase family 2 protein [Chlorobiaceae bacterium]|nr:glycosyltransferase family 2 protein [Chlorobiaceae bacterium]